MASKFIARSRRHFNRLGELISLYIESSLKTSSLASDISGVETYCMFLGYPRSGSSIIGALLDAHPEMIFAHELNSLRFIRAGFSKNQLFYLLIKKSRDFAGRGSTWSGYRYQVPNQWNGRYSRLRVIGDKKAGDSAFLLRKHPEYIDKLRKVVEVPVKFIHVIRNPYDVISTRSIKSGTSLEASIDYFFYRCESVSSNRRLLERESIIDIRLEEFIKNPESGLISLCRFLGVPANDDYIHDAAGIVFASPNKSRLSVEWPDNLKQLVVDRASHFPFLSGYNFDAD
jgi:hypothetical protein